MTQPVFRFAPSPNGELHLGHAYSALVNFAMTRQAGGRFLLRIEDIDTTRCTPEFEQGIYRDLAFLGLKWEYPVRRQSQHFDDYRLALEHLIEAGLAYPAFMTRSEVRSHIAGQPLQGQEWPHDPDGAFLYPGIDRNLSASERQHRMERGDLYAWRLDMKAALAHIGRAFSWEESDQGPTGETGIIPARPEIWGDVVIARKDIPASYHLSVVVDDALQGVTHVVRGRDLYHATAIHRLLQELLGLPVPLYHHHDLILADDGRKLSKSQGDTSIAALRESGATARDIARMVGFKEGG